MQLRDRRRKTAGDGEPAVTRVTTFRGRNRWAKNVTPDVTIIGAGPYGLSLAAHLEAKGISFRIVGVKTAVPLSDLRKPQFRPNPTYEKLSSRKMLGFSTLRPSIAIASTFDAAENEITVFALRNHSRLTIKCTCGRVSHAGADPEDVNVEITLLPLVYGH